MTVVNELTQSSSGAMSQQERDLLIDLLISSQERLISTTQGLTVGQWTFGPGPDRWSIAECAEHLSLSEESLLGIVRGQVLATAPNPAAAAEARGRDGVVVDAMRNRSNRLKTFDFLVPRTTAPTPAAFVDGWVTRRATTLQYVRQATDSLHHHFAPLGALGELDGYQWLLLLASHTERHIAQMEEVMSHPGYPV